jgi:type VI secretion system protein ImpF
MSRLDPDVMLMPSIIDRLIDPTSGGTIARRGYTVEQMIDAVRRDLEDLMNTRRTNPYLPTEFVEVLNSIEAYGMPDLTSLNAITMQQREAIGRVIESIVQQFEPRLKDIHATLLDTGQKVERSLRFHIEARLALEPAPEVAFETVLELTTGHASVRQTEGLQ